MPKGNINIGKRLSEFIYSFNTNDRYADYNTNELSKKAAPRSRHHLKSVSNATEYVTSPIGSPLVGGDSGIDGSRTSSISGSGKFAFKRRSFFGKVSTKLTSPVLDNSYNSPDVALAGDFDIQNEGVSETVLAWRHIELWTNKHHSDLAETLSPPVTRNDISKAEQDLNIEFPPSVVASLRIHDGQDFSGSYKDYSGLFFTLQLMSLDKIVEMTMNWRKVSDKINDKMLQRKLNNDILMNLKSPELTHETEFHNNLSKNKETHKSRGNGPSYQALDTTNHEVNPNLEHDLKIATLKYDVSSKAANLSVARSNLQNQASVPPNTVHDVYAHRDWIPMITDNAGNHIAIDLSPAVNGKYGQVILFGRDFDIKYVVANTWGDFLLNFAKDLETGNYIIRSDELVDDIMASDGELLFYDKRNRIERNYFDVLKERVVAKYEARKNHSQRTRQRAPTIITNHNIIKSAATHNDDMAVNNSESHTNSVEQDDPAKNFSYEESELLDISESPAVADKSFTFGNGNGDLAYESHIPEPSRTGLGTADVLAPVLSAVPAGNNAANPYLGNILSEVGEGEGEQDTHSSRVSSSQRFSSEASSITATSFSNNDHYNYNDSFQNSGHEQNKNDGDHDNSSNISNSTYLASANTNASGSKPTAATATGAADLETVKVNTIASNADYSKGQNKVNGDVSLNEQFENIAI